MKITGILFDKDGTLFDYHASWMPANRRAALEVAGGDAALGDELLATDLADWLVRRGVPFRQSHHLVGRVVRRAEELGCGLSALPLAELQTVSPVFTADVSTVWDVEQSVEQRAVIGGTARASVQAQIAELRQLL